MGPSTYPAYYRSPIGIIEITGTDWEIQSLRFTDEALDAELAPPYLRTCQSQLDEYFRGKRREFTLHFQLEGTAFQKQVWQQLLKIPYGGTASYRDIAAAIGKEKAVRAVGQANHRNRIAILIPCHRVIGSDGDLTGYGGGLWRKSWLLDHEHRIAEGS